MYLNIVNLTLLYFWFTSFSPLVQVDGHPASTAGIPPPQRAGPAQGLQYYRCVRAFAYSKYSVSPSCESTSSPHHFITSSLFLITCAILSYLHYPITRSPHLLPPLSSVLDVLAPFCGWWAGSSFDVALDSSFASVGVAAVDESALLVRLQS